MGRIVAGEQLGRVVEVVDDAEATGGFLIFTYADVDRSPEVFDGWVLTLAEVQTYFDRYGWDVAWLDS